MALKKWNVVRPENIKKETMFNTPPQPVSGGHHIVLLYTVARETHLMMPATRPIKELIDTYPIRSVCRSPYLTYSNDWAPMAQTRKNASAHSVGVNLESTSHKVDLQKRRRLGYCSNVKRKLFMTSCLN